MTSKVHVVPGQELQVFKLLEERGVTTWLDDELFFSDSSGKLLNGLFGVIKPSKFTPGKPVLRVIMNLIPANSLLQVICGDIKFLPGAAMWLPLTMADGEELHLSQGDMSAAFYLFELPALWQQFMAFKLNLNGKEIGRGSTRWFRPVCRVLPMGWKSSVGIMQMISRELLLQDGLPRELELHRARRVPSWFTDVVNSSKDKTCWWQVYLDNFMAAEKSSCGHSMLDIKLQEAAMKAWSSAGLLTAEDKQVLGSRKSVCSKGPRHISICTSFSSALVSSGLRQHRSTASHDQGKMPIAARRNCSTKIHLPSTACISFFVPPRWRSRWIEAHMVFMSRSVEQPSNPC